MKSNKKCPILPCGDIVVLREDAPITRVGHILVEERASRRGVVCAVGPDIEDIRVRTKVLFRNWLAEVEAEGQRWLLVPGDDILARVE